MLEQLRARVQELIAQSADDPKALKKYEAIEKILSFDDCFLQVPIEDAYAILRDLGVPEEKVGLIYREIL